MYKRQIIRLHVSVPYNKQQHNRHAVFCSYLDSFQYEIGWGKKKIIVLIPLQSEDDLSVQS